MMVQYAQDSKEEQKKTHKNKDGLVVVFLLRQPLCALLWPACGPVGKHTRAPVVVVCWAPLPQAHVESVGVVVAPMQSQDSSVLGVGWGQWRHTAVASLMLCQLPHPPRGSTL